ncbi:transposase [Vibrio sp. SCSIO 43140]|uniref:IS66 family transposase n=1 Tax=Vibrio sp. SCSIO 43140 TaxID=2819100 RepID=UPI002186A1C5|nr:transposase [Vibrio sp. SCSIO 43140]
MVESSALGQASKYTQGHWTKLVRFIDNGLLSIDKNRTNSAIKSLAFVRSNSYDLFQFFDNPLSSL